MLVVKFSKTEHPSGKIRDADKQFKQTTLDSLLDVSQKEISKPIGSEQKKQIEITKIDTVAREDELIIKIEFRLLPSKTVFSKITSELFFDGQK